MINKCKALLTLLCLTTLITLPGCRPDTSIDDYKIKMETFYDRLSDYDHALNTLDPNLDSAIPDMLYYIDGIADIIKEMASYQVPEHFYGVPELAKQADEYMTEAVSLFNQAFLAPEYDDNIADAATENYERANLRLRYIAEILKGDIPEEIFTFTN